MTLEEIQVLSEEQIQQVSNDEMEYNNQLDHKKFIAVTHGSKMKNGDEIIDSLQSAFEFRLYHDREIP